MPDYKLPFLNMAQPPQGQQKPLSKLVCTIKRIFILSALQFDQWSNNLICVSCTDVSLFSPVRLLGRKKEQHTKNTELCKYNMHEKHKNKEKTECNKCDNDKLCKVSKVK